MCRTYTEDTIDFQCSDSWRDHYFERGLTAFHSPGYKGCRDRLWDGQERLEEVVRALADLVRGAPARDRPPDMSGVSGGHVRQVQAQTLHGYTRIP